MRAAARSLYSLRTIPPRYPRVATMIEWDIAGHWPEQRDPLADHTGTRVITRQVDNRPRGRNGDPFSN